MSPKEEVYWLGLNMNTTITPRRFHILLGSYPSLEAVWNAPEDELENIEGFEKAAAEFCEQRDLDRAKREFEMIKNKGLSILTLDKEKYPDPLRTLEYPPPVLYLKGNYCDEDQFGISIVGTRKFSDYGRYMAKKIAGELVQAGFTVISGMARGIDTFAHRASIEAEGRTIAVLGTGFNHIYPSSNISLMRKIADQGAVLSEFHLDHGPAKWTFPQRNRIISGLSRGTVVVEAPAQSGALITARSALEQGREVFAVPGDTRRDSVRGTHALIKDGAKLVEGGRDVVEEFGDLEPELDFGDESQSEEEVLAGLSSAQKQVYEQLEYEPKHFNELVSDTGFPPARLSHIMFQLQMEDLASRIEGNRWVKPK